MTEAEKSPKKAVKRAPKAPKTSDKGSFAVIATGGKQYRVSVGDKIKIEKLPGEHKEGDSLTFDKVLLMNSGELNLGKPFIKDAKVSATLAKIGRDKTIDVIKYKQKSRYFKKYGHRQPHFEVKIDSIN